MCTLDVVNDGGRCFLIRFIVKLGHLVSYAFLISHSSVCFTGLNSVV